MKKLSLLFLLVTFINVLLFFFRDNLQYVKYSTYNELYAPCNEACVNKWDDFTQAYSAATFDEGRRMLQPLRLDTGSTLSKITAIGRHLYIRFNKQAGYPQDIIHHSTPLEDYKILSADTTQKIWCGTYAIMFSFFCWSQNIVCRFVEIYKPGDHHVLNECWVPELAQWVMVDVTSNLLGAEKNDRWLNTQDFVRAVANPGSLTLLSAEPTERKHLAGFAQYEAVKNYYNAKYPFYYYHLTQGAMVYRPLQKLERYFLPHYWYEIFSLSPKSNLLFWAKPILAALWLFLACLWAIKWFSK